MWPYWLICFSVGISMVVSIIIVLVVDCKERDYKGTLNCTKLFLNLTGCSILVSRNPDKCKE